MQARLPFPHGVVWVHSPELLRPIRWYLWQLPHGPHAEQLAAHEAMRQALISALHSGTCAAAIGTPAFASQAAASQHTAEGLTIDCDSPGAAPRGFKRSLHGHDTQRQKSGAGTPCMAIPGKRVRQSGRDRRPSVRFE